MTCPPEQPVSRKQMNASQSMHASRSLDQYGILRRGIRRSSGASSTTISSDGIDSTRRSLSDTVVGEGNNFSFPRTNATFSLVQRSGAPVIRDLVTVMRTKTAADNPPFSECSALAGCATDPYYRVVISATGGIQATIDAMTKFSGFEEIQAAGCAALGSLCTRNGSNQLLVQQQGGLSAVLESMRMYPLSIAVQSSACDALMHLTSQNASNLLILRNTPDSVTLIEQALQRFLPPSCRESAMNVLQSLLD
eukprot:CAMPEP_0183295186 /NCGR_PEP_ID=MMETSP0160_2-20130417/3233_1 /TAXON_ID=2839 ORGANISM="Odontella Sinensis, Strain Grunow 1884" /NCGR_SAMPLE_ID=MMETSP0160_2 /ASSEMBLY_ACC=CAM_ASM_000250 /LENGTH=250 /DNA_ID=CAMNT_0025456625 /DNA_START=63 /DNA_END=815 /DNA_ORIENTATION=+